MVVLFCCSWLKKAFPARELEVLQIQHISIWLNDRPTSSVLTTSAVLGRLCKSGADNVGDIGIGRENPVVLADAFSELVNSKSRIDMNAFSKIIFIIFTSSFQRDVEDENKLPLLKAHSVQVLNLFFYFVTWLQ